MNEFVPSLDFWLTSWTFEPSIWFGLIALHGGYLLVAGPLRTLFPTSQPVRSRQLALWTLGILALFAALITPISRLADQYLLSVHMLQHVLLTLIAPPLLLLGTPAWFLDPLQNHRGLLGVGRFLTHPFVAYASFNVVFAAWHIPALYNLALYAPIVHIFEHVSMLFTAVLTWMPVLSPTKLLPRLPLPVQVFYLFLQSIVGTGLGAIITLAKQPIYLYYEQAQRIWGIPALEDQVWAGLIMWVGTAMIFLLALTLVFFRWFGAKGPIEGEHDFI